MKAGILRVHPDLAGKLAQAGQLTKESCLEQSAANLDSMSPQEKTLLNLLNSQYKDKFGFPFVICVRLNKKEAIIDGLKTRTNHDIGKELETGIGEVLKICELRMKDLVQSSSSKL